MSNHKNPKSTDSGDDGYEVGYGKPPKHGRFRPGQSGNPAGRRKGVRNLVTDVRRLLATPVNVKVNGRTRRRSTQEAALLMLRDKLFFGDARALALFFELARRFNSETAEGEISQALAAADQAILDVYVAERVGAPIPPATAETPDDLASNTDTGSGNKAPK